MKAFIRFLMSEGRGQLVITKSVKELLFDGYEDPLLSILRANGNPSIPKVSFVLGILQK
jgi:CD36 family